MKPEPTTAEMRSAALNAVAQTFPDAMDVVCNYLERLEDELRGVRAYWLCLDGLTVEGLMAGAQCPDCGMGKEHAAALVPAEGAGDE